VPELSPADRELQGLAADLRKLEAEYTTYFAGRSARPPIEGRRRLDQAVKRLERTTYETQALRFQFAALQARYSAFADLWDRALRAREEGRPSPFNRQVPSAATDNESNHGPSDLPVVLHTAAFSDPVGQLDRLRDLYDVLMDARRETGHDAVPFHRFADLVKRQVAELQERHHREEVSFRVVKEDGRVTFKARPGGAATEE
jgi:hypothetical protein